MIQADGGTRTAAISGAWVALRIAVDKLLATKADRRRPDPQAGRGGQLRHPPGERRCSTSIMTRTATAGCDGNFVLTADGAIVEAQMTAEGECYRRGRPAAPAPPRPDRLRGDFRRPRSRRPAGEEDRRTSWSSPATIRASCARSRRLLEPLGIACVGAEELDLPEPEEIGTTFVDNADLKAREAADLSGLPALADDSGLCVDALHGRPGIFSARWAEDEDGKRDWMRAMAEGLARGRSDRARRRPGRPFRLRAGARLAQDGQAEWFEGRVDGTLVWPPRGDQRLRL